jgi:hypothetical protein
MEMALFYNEQQKQWLKIAVILEVMWQLGQALLLLMLEIFQLLRFPCRGTSVAE